VEGVENEGILDTPGEEFSEEAVYTNRIVESVDIIKNVTI
jgi:hypothetical protein